MKKSLMKVLCLATCAVMVLPTIGCNRDEGAGVGSDNAGNLPVDVNKTQLAIANENGGWGDQWLRRTATAFEEFYKDTVFEEGKKGVQVTIDNKAVGEVQGSGALNKMEGSRDVIWFTESADYLDYANSGKILEITDLLTTPLTEYGESKAIIDKMDDFLVDNLKLNDKYYMLPYYNSFWNMSYDVELFNDNCLYFKKGATTDGMDVFAEDADLESLFITDLSEEMSVGPDNVPGTIDDGLPVTYDDFFALTKYMKFTCGITPTGFMSGYGYLTGQAYQLWANELGYEGLLRNYQLSGTANDLIDVSADGTVTNLDPVEISSSNGYMLQKDSSRYEVLKFIYDFVKHDYIYDAQAFSSALTHTGAQDRFLYSSNASYNTIGILLEGNWWWNEARGTFNSMGQEMDTKYSRQNRDIGIMPTLRSTRPQGDEPAEFALLDGMRTYCMINASTKGVQLDLAKKFFRFMFTNQALQIFMQETGSTRGCEVTFTDAEYEALPYYARCFYNIRKNSEMVYPVSTNLTVANNSNTFAPFTWSFSTSISGDMYDAPFNTFKNYNVTPEQYFNGLYAYQQPLWAGLRK